MSEQNVGLVRRIFEAGGADDADVVLQFVPEDVVWYPPPEWIVKSEYRGHEGVREVMAVFTETFDDYAAEIHDLREAGDSVVALIWQTGRIKGGGSPIRQAIGAVYSDFRDGKIGESRFFRSWEEALEAAGLSGSADPPAAP